jgi:sphingomyelin phosphodiesterase acid-like 3
MRASGPWSGNAPESPRRSTMAGLLAHARAVAIGVIALACTALSSWPTSAEVEGRVGRFIALSDIHLDPFAAPELITPLMAAEPERWPAVLAPPADDQYGRYGRDSTWALLRSALDQMREVEPNPAFVILTGDLLAHRFRDKFQAVTRELDEGRYRSFVAKIVTFVGDEIARRFPGRQVFLALGNEDSDCGDYRLSPNGAFLEATLPLARRLSGAAEDGAFTQDWRAGRFYDVASTAVEGLRVIAVNSIYLSAKYRDACGNAPDPGSETLAWLEARLAAAERIGETVWLVMHIPPGADAFATVRDGACTNGPVAMWDHDHTRRFLDLSRRYAHTIGAVFTGHTHMDEFRLIGRNGEMDTFALGTPAISPVYGQNPGFHVHTYDGSRRLVERETWRAADLTTAPASGLGWHKEYVFSELWQLPAINAPSLSRLDQLIEKEPRVRAEWFSVYPVGRTAMWRLPDVASLPPTAFRAYHCAISRVDADEYRECLCGTGR